MGARSDRDSDSHKNREKRIYTSSKRSPNKEDEVLFESTSIEREYQSTSVPTISLNSSITTKKSETLKEALIRDIGEDLSDLEMDFISKFIAISGTMISYSGTKKEQKANFNKFIDSMIHKFPNLAMKLSSVQLNYTMNYLKQSMEEEK